MKGLQHALWAALCWYASPASAYEPDVFGTANGVARQAVYDESRSDLACHFAPPSAPLSLEEVIERILCHDPQVRLSWANAKARAAQVGVSQSAYLPRLDGRLNGSRGNGNIDYDNPALRSGDGHRRRNSSSLDLNWVLFDFGRRDAALNNARQLLRAANANQDSALQAAFIQAAQDYYGALAAERTLAASDQIAEVAAQNLEAADAKYKAGAAALSDRLQAQTAFSQAYLRQIRDRGTLRNALGNIALRIGLAPETPLHLAGDLNRFPDTHFVKAVDELLAQARQEHPAMLAAQARLEAAKAAIEETRAAGMPSIALTASLSRGRNDQSQVFNGNSNDRDRSVALQVSIPLFEGFSRSYQIRIAQAQVEAGQAQLADTEQQVALDLWSNYQTLRIDTESLQRTSELVTQSRQSLQVVQGRYRSGVGSMIELLNALTAYTDAQNQHIQTLNSWQTSRLGLAASLGRLGFWTLE
ncbi:outer membrane efflux protein [Pseudomonas synxantha BG33R]|uniref:TolC family protein n=1 Tax=Pseudomonas synxantha TaxID=47883 RepID=UPI00025FEEE7|nr:TolC family protein [Pseudomonas synxantha]EIK69680.1 outer membrane efflux protein [Pseudomonas synxantha BG33R]